jgi:hypothetical protein
MTFVIASPLNSAADALYVRHTMAFDFLRGQYGDHLINFDPGPEGLGLAEHVWSVPEQMDLLTYS